MTYPQARLYVKAINRDEQSRRAAAMDDVRTAVLADDKTYRRIFNALTNPKDDD
jgi:hypothetical protein